MAGKMQSFSNKCNNRTLFQMTSPLFECSVHVQVYVLEKAGVSISRLLNVVVSLILALEYDIITGDAQRVFNRWSKVVVSSMFLLTIHSATCLWNPGSWIMPECVWQFHLRIRCCWDIVNAGKVWGHLLKQCFPLFYFTIVSEIAAHFVPVRKALLPSHNILH
jgi:hypothetical protein